MEDITEKGEGGGIVGLYAQGLIPEHSTQWTHINDIDESSTDDSVL